MSEEYHGWKNKETWATNQRLTNTKSLYNRTIELLKEWKEEAKEELKPKEDIKPFHLSEESRKSFIRTYQADRLKEWLEELRNKVFDGEIETVTVKDMFKEIGSLWRVNFYEIVDGFKEDIEDCDESDVEDENYTPSLLYMDDRPHEDY